MMDAVKILVERIDTHPEEFTKNGPWGKIIAEYRDLIPPDEVELLNEKLNEARTKQFTSAVIEQLMRGSDESVERARIGPSGFGIGVDGGVITNRTTDPLVYKTTNRYAIEDFK